jgi:hypothetical protein
MVGTIPLTEICMMNVVAVQVVLETTNTIRGIVAGCLTVEAILQRYVRKQLIVKLTKDFLFYFLTGNSSDFLMSQPT